MNADIPYFYGEQVALKKPIQLTRDAAPVGYSLRLPWWEREATITFFDMPAGTLGTYLKRVYRPVLGNMNLIRVKTDIWSGWCLLTDDEIEVLHG